ncbi:MAG: hypothetical protein HYT72_01860 [Candidatus Aenigmarchaeota archaeon]|nr:hypothetical protein [Candidatus Aenigmarchaeota archaeon]
MGLRHVFGELAEATGVSYRTLQKIVPLLVKRGIIKETREVGKAKMYSLNFDSPSVKKLDEFSLASDTEFAEKGRKQRPLLIANKY